MYSTCAETKHFKHLPRETARDLLQVTNRHISWPVLSLPFLPNS